jgi:hypothetical protein
MERVILIVSDMQSALQTALTVNPGLTEQIGARLNRGYVRRGQACEER